MALEIVIKNDTFMRRNGVTFNWIGEITQSLDWIIFKCNIFVLTTTHVGYLSKKKKVTVGTLHLMIWTLKSQKFWGRCVFFSCVKLPTIFGCQHWLVAESGQELLGNCPAVSTGTRQAKYASVSFSQSSKLFRMYEARRAALNINRLS